MLFARECMMYVPAWRASISRGGMKRMNLGPISTQTITLLGPFVVVITTIAVPAWGVALMFLSPPIGEIS